MNPKYAQDAMATMKAPVMLEIVRDSGHFLFMDKPAPFNDQLRLALEQLPDGSKTA